MKIRQMFNRLTKKSKFILGGIAALAILTPAVAIAGYGPNGADRVIYNFSNPAQREGAFDGPRFNSYINTNVYGDERGFVDAKECTTLGAACYQQGQAGGYRDQQPVVAGKEYIIRAYVHNIANPSINDNPATAAPMDGIGVAKNTKIRFELPNTEGVANGFTAQARITADNALPQLVYDTVDLRNNDEKFNVSYVPGSAYIFNASHPSGLNLSDDIMGANGTLIGNDKMDGNYGGCFEYSAFVIIRVKVTAPEVDIEKFVSKVEMPKMTDTSETVNVKRGDTVHWRLNYQNKGTLFADDVTVRDPLPEGLEIVPNSIKLTTALGTVTLPDTALGSGGANVGDYIPTGNGVIRYSTKVNTKPEVCELVNKAFVKAANTPKEDSDTAKIVITDCNPTQPVYTCDSFTLTLLRDRTYKFETKATAKNGAVIKFYEYNFGDNTTVLQTDAASVEHTYAADGNYVANVKVTFEVDGKLVTVGGTENCSKSLSMLTSYTCDSFTLTLVRDRTYKFETKASAKGSATIKGYEYNFGDNTEVVKTDKNTVEHTYAKDGTYTSVVTVVFMVDGQEKKVTNDNCKKTVSFEHNKPMCDLPGKGHLPKDSPECKVLGVTTLPKTGAGSIIGLMASVTVAGSALHRRMTLRRNS